MNKPPMGITPPAPGLDREEPDYWVEDDIPTDDSHGSAKSERDPARDERPGGRSERE